MKVKWIGQECEKDITKYVSTVNWSGSISQAARTLEITMLYSPFDDNIADININLGDRIKLYSDNSELLIDIMVYYRERNSEAGTVTYSGYDELNHLLRSNISKNFKNITPEKITEIICNELKIKIGSIEKTNVNIKSLLADSTSGYDIIMQAYTKAYNTKGKKYMPIMSGKKLYIIEKGSVIENFILSDYINVTSSNYSESLDSMINKVKIYSSKGKLIDVVKNDNWISSYGLFQGIYAIEDGVKATAAAKSILKGLDKTASIEAIGNTDCISGYGIKIEDKLTGLTGIFWIDSDAHTWQNGIHTMSLELAFKNIMDTKE